jgi:nitrous oxide reductase
MKKSTTKPVQRRSFLKGAAVAGTAVGAGALTTQTLAEATVNDTEPEQSSGYRETEHIRKYYKLARF